MEQLDEILLKRFISGDISGFESLVSRYQGKIFAFIYRMLVSEEDARDLTQEVFLQVFRSVEKFRGEAKFSTWLYRIAANKSLDFLRRNKRAKPVEMVEVASASDSLITTVVYTNPEDIFLREEKIRRLRRMIAGLPDRYRVVLVMFHYENLSYQQIAEALEVPVKTVATRLYRAKLILKELVGGEKDGLS